jgi:hypothetical protein
MLCEYLCVKCCLVTVKDLPTGRPMNRPGVGFVVE